jgi:hypothetical protein
MGGAVKSLHLDKMSTDAPTKFKQKVFLGGTPLSFFNTFWGLLPVISLLWALLRLKEI